MVVTFLMLAISLYALNMYKPNLLNLGTNETKVNKSLLNKFLDLLSFLGSKKSQESITFKTIAVTSGGIVVNELKNLQHSLSSGDTVGAKLWGRMVENEAKRAIEEVKNFGQNSVIEKYVYGLKLAQIAGEKAQLVQNKEDIKEALYYTKKALSVLEPIVSGYMQENLKIIKELSNLK